MSEIEKFSIFDSRVVQKRPLFSVEKGPLSNTNSPFNAISATSSQMTFNIQVSSQQVFVDREVNWTTGVNCRMDVNVAGVGGAIPAPNTPVVVFGKDCALAPFPLQSLCSTMTATINDCVSTINTGDVLYEVTRLTDLKYNKLRKSTPSMLDKYAFYNDAVQTINNPLASYFDATDYDNVPNGAFWDIVFTAPNGSPLVGSGSYASSAGGNQTISFVNGVPVLTAVQGGANALENYDIYFRWTVSEKLVLSPFIFNEECGDSVGLFGVNNIQLVMNFGSGVQRVIRNAPLGTQPAGRTITNVNFNGSAPFVAPRVDVIQLTPSLDIALPPKSVVPYLEYPRYISTPNQVIQPNSSATLTSQTITLPAIPDMLIIYAKPQTYGDISGVPLNAVGDFYCPITQLSVQFDNFAGLLSSHSKTQLYQMTTDNGLRMDWNTWNGSGKVVNKNPADAVALANANNVSLVGGFLVLKMGKDITLQAGQAPSVVNYWRLGK